jgi:hypothetical protein
MNVKEINTAIISANFSNSDLDSIQDAIKFAKSRIASQLSVTLGKGSKVSLSHAKLGGRVFGTVLKVKIKKADVKLDSGMTYSVPLSMLTVA